MRTLIPFAIAAVALAVTVPAQAQFRKVSSFGPDVGRASLLGALQGRLLYATSATISGEQPVVWATDGTSAPEKLFTSTNEYVIQYPSTAYGVVGGLFLFSDGTSLYATRGTLATTTKLADVPLRAKSSFAIVSPTRAYFTGATTAAVQDIWTTDGTVDGTLVVAHVARSSAVDSTQPRFLPAGGGTIFTVDDEKVESDDGLWTIEPSSASRVLVGSGYKGHASCGAFAILDGVGSSRGLGTTTGTSAGTKHLVDSGLQLTTGTCLNDRTFVVQGMPNKLYATDGDEVIVLDQDEGDGARPEYGPIGAGTLAYYRGYLPKAAPGKALLRTDGTVAGTFEVYRAPDGDALGGIVLNAAATTKTGALVVPITGDVTGYVVTNGSVAGTTVVADENFSRIAMPLAVADKAYFWVNRGPSYAPWVSDGTAAGTKELSDTLRSAEPATTGVYEADARFVELDGELFTLANDAAVGPKDFEIFALRIAPSTRTEAEPEQGPDGGSSSSGDGGAASADIAMPGAAPALPSGSSDDGCALGGRPTTGVVGWVAVALSSLLLRRRSRRA